MTAYNFRSLLLAVIVLSNCITWTASRHHYAHNVHQHRTRHRRQGAGLYLPASYVIPGGEGSGPWGDWGEISPCSRTCGGGVASQKRICLEPGPQNSCTGGDTKYFSCQTQDCPAGSGDFRAEQCAEFNDKEFRGYKYNWVPYTKAPNPCELNCMPHAERFYFRHKQRVADGTRCNEDSFDVCVNGVCQHVGCDMMLGSSAREDKCRECRGNGTNCHTMEGLFDSQDLLKGYNDILLIPEGSTTIIIEEIEPSNNYLALRAKNGTYYLNGHYHIDFPRSIMIAGALWTYERSQQGFPAPDKLRCLGPITEPLYLSLLLQDVNVGIKYEYSIPNNSTPPTDKQYNWVHEEFTPCSATCGGGFQTRNVTCRSREELEVVDSNLCDEGLKPPTNQSCNQDPCPAQWVAGPWGDCSKRCGSGGVKSREVTCQKVIANGIASIVPDKECFDLLGPKPELFQKCNEDAPCPDWFVGHWKPCDKLCDEGKQTRQVVCRQKINGRVTVLGDGNCTDEKPTAEQKCMIQPCDGVDWVTSDWTGCDTCFSKLRTRSVTCATKGQQVLNDSFCTYHNRPVEQEECDEAKLPPCEVQWYATQWSKCSVECGDGVQTRKVFCGLLSDDSVEKVEDSKCAHLPKYNDTKPCSVPKEKCPAQWFTGPWTECTKKCGGGEQYRRVMCLRGSEQSSDCPGDMVLDSTQFCNTGPCDKDDLLPVDKKSTVVMDDDDDYCDEDAEMEEVGLDLDLTDTTPDLPLSDSPITSYAEHEVSLDTGSGFTSLSTDDLTTDEGSGFSSLSTDTTDLTDYDDDGSGETTVKSLVSTTTTRKPPLEPDVVASSATKLGSSPTDSTSSDSDSTDSETGSTPTGLTDDTEETASTDGSSTDSAGSTAEPASTSSDEAGATSSTEADTKDTDATESTVEASSNATESDSTSSDETGATILTEADATGSTTEASSISTESDSTSSDETGGTGSTEAVTKDTTGSTEEEDTSSTDSSLSTDVKGTLSTEATSSAASESSTESTDSSSDSDKTTLTAEESSTENASTGSVGTDKTTSTGETDSTVTKETSGTELTSSKDTDSTESTVTKETSSTESTAATEESSSTESAPTDTSSSTESAPTESTVTEESSPSESTITEETDTTGTTDASETDSTVTEITETATNTDSTDTEETTDDLSTTDLTTSAASKGSTITTRKMPTEPAVTTTPKEISTSDSSESTSETDSTSNVESTTTSGLATGESDSTTEESGATTEESGPTTVESGSTTVESESTSVKSDSTPVESGSTTVESDSTTVESDSTTEESGSTTVASGSTTVKSETTTEESGSTTAGSTDSEETKESTTAGAETTTEAVESSSLAESTEGKSTTEETSTEAVTSTPEGETTVETTGSSVSGSTEESSAASESESTVESESTTVAGETTTEISGSSTEQSTAESSEDTASTESPVESSTLSESTTGSETSTISEDNTTVEAGTEETTGLSGLTTTEEPTTGGVLTTKASWHDVLLTKTTCKPRRKRKCNKTKFGCCPDNKTAALGPFDEGCSKPRTCKDSTYGCCPDGVSPKLGDTDEGCPVEACADTLFGCCLSDNKTAAQGNDQEGCPPPPPACATAEFGCCADNETEATGPEKAGCPETSTTAAGAETTTEALETSEGSTTGADTTAAGSTEVGSTTLDLCSGFEFGCCADNQTEAKGPDGQGCPCNATEFGCCPDGVSPAKGADSEGCPGPCSTSPHGCCEDNKTPAHGPNFEGCCLLHAFGCCPDNRKPAEGPHLEGCGCQYSLHGCCPDNVTIAQGADNQGCGCQYTQHGCCPDRHTAASGPDNEGCGCSTHQFGCCPDGVTIAKGPEQQGCHCHYSLYGCCGDGITPATGPDAAGCDCSSSKHGCCPDGTTEAAGPKFFGCTDVPENKQAACSLPTDPGSCHNFTAMWYFDMTYGGCSRFWYGGCEGNGNRFATKEDCEDVCVQPSPKDACNLPSVKGACDGSYEHWHYNSTREQCVPFLYGGCLGNANNFETRELCQKQCEPKAVEGQCDLPIEQGSCAGNFSRWGFNPDTRSCEQFIWGGCEGNSNRFNTEAACQMRCNPPGSQPPQCAEPQEAGSCGNKEALWSFSVSENRCVPFYYSGCGGNNNRFPSREACEQTCPAAYVPDKCTLPAETGQCSNYRERWFFDTTFKRCRQFYYGGCGGNENNFATEAECENSCSELKTTTTTTTTTTTVRPAEPQPAPRPEEPSRPDICFLEIDAGPCTNMQTRFAYDSKLGRCITFQYGGCAGNQNNFPDLEYCTFYCHPIQDICQLPMLAGPCDDSQMRWFYDPSSDSCSQFTYGGCEGNDNRFETREACESRCKTGPVPAATTPSTTVAVGSRFGEDLASECKITESLEVCQHGGLVWYFEPDQRECVSLSNRESGAVCRHTGTFTSQEACERSCGAFRGVDVCKQALDPGPCQSYVTKVYFDSATSQCREFSYGGCLGGANRFSTIEECNQVCETAVADPCILPPEPGTCGEYIRQWYYDPARDQCNQFAFTGCGGNTNRFETRRDCESRCKRPEPSTTTTVAPQPPPQPHAEPECRTPTSLEPCGNNVTVFYYDAERQQCLVSGFGGCEHPNSYRTEEECERTCGAFRGLDVCGASLDPGPCRASIPKIYWDDLTGSCQPYAYGGCNGGPNRFSNVEECESVCGGTGPAPECLQAVDTGESCGVVEARRWHYSVAHVDCVAFVYLGCGGNNNNFRSYEECADVCGLSRTTGREDQNQIPVPDCTAAQQQCEAIDCQYGVAEFMQEGCKRCQCNDDPCIRANCSSHERCVAVAVRNPAYQEPQYSATCVEETNEIDDCEEYVANCSRLRCEYNVQHTRLPNGCTMCSCVQLETDCTPLINECETIECTYGIQKTIGSDGCQRCSCKEYPCEKKSCPPGDRCVVIPYNDGIDLVTKYTADCRTVTKPGFCPMDETTTNEVICRHECNDDADCRGVGKCCRRGCSDLCLVPVEQTSPPTVINTTLAPDVPAPPQALPQQEPQVAASEGGKATLRCLFHGNPPPKITWRHGELTIDGNAGRYRLMSDGALEIVSLYRNDTGVYICVADNGLGVATQEIHLVVNDPVKAPVGIAGDENAVVTGELGSPLSVRCLAYGYPPPTVFWYRGYDGTMVPYNDAVFEARGNVLLIRSLAIETLGQYTCQAYNGEGKAASWVVNVRAYRPDGLFIENELLVPRVTMVPRPKTQAPTTAELTTTTSTTEARIPVYTVPVSAHVSSTYSTLNVGANLELTCEVDGFPAPDVYWTKDSVRLQHSDRILITGSEVVSRLTVQRVTVSDSGLYACHASNLYTSETDTAQVNVQQLLVPAKCTDNPFFANCDLIVRSKFCRHKYYSKFCCKSCVEAGQLDPQDAEFQADQPLKKKK